MSSRPQRHGEYGFEVAGDHIALQHRIAQVRAAGNAAFWLLLMAVAGVWLWRRQTWGYLVAGAVLTLWVLESIGVAVDQWFGHNADSTSAVASGTMVWVFAGLAAVGCVPLAFFFRNVAHDA